ncbi:MAG: chaperone modulator CbpM [Isosphaeraceae bacterium]
MHPTLIPRDQAARALSVAPSVLLRYEEYGLVQALRREGVEGYAPAEVRRLWTIVSCQRDLGINLAGVEAVLKLRDHLALLHEQLDDLARRLSAIVDEQATHVSSDA